MTFKCGWCGKPIKNAPVEASGRAYCSVSHAKKALSKR